MMKRKYGFLTVLLALCLSLTACGSDNEETSGGDTEGTLSVTGYSELTEENGGGLDLANDEAPSSFEGMVKDSMLLPDENAYLGTWLGEDNSELIVEMSEMGDEVRFALYDTTDEITASGFIQYVPDYSADYFYNEYDGVAYHSWTADSGELQVDGIGTFSKVSGDVPGETVGDLGYEFLAGSWYLDAEADAVSILEIDELGNWTLYERPAGDGDPNVVDYGTISPNPDGEGMYTAVSDMFEDVAYDMTVIDDNVMYWGGENDYYEKMA